MANGLKDVAIYAIWSQDGKKKIVGPILNLQNFLDQLQEDGWEKHLDQSKDRAYFLPCGAGQADSLEIIGPLTEPWRCRQESKVKKVVAKA